MDFNQLPNSWLRLFVSTLPCCLRRTLRQCSRSLQQFIDSTATLQLDLRDGYNARALALCSENVVALHVPGSLHPESALQLAQQITDLGGLPSLQRLLCSTWQPDVIAAIASSSKQLSSLRVSPAGGLHHAVVGQHWEHFVHKICVLKAAESLRNLELVFLPMEPDFLSARSSEVMGALTQLESLTLTIHHGMTYSLSGAAEELWTAAICPLTRLTTHCPLSLCGAVAVPAGAEGLSNLRQLSWVFRRMVLAPTRGYCPGSMGEYQWLAKCNNLTQLQLQCHISQVDFTAIGSLKQLCSLTLSYFPSEHLSSDALRPLTACKYLTTLEVDTFNLTASPKQYPDSAHGPGPDPSTTPTTVLARTSTTGLLTANDLQHQLQQQLLRHPRQHGQQSSHQLSGSTSVTSSSAWQLTSLRKLSVGNIGVAHFYAPVSTLAPNLTELQDSADTDFAGRNYIRDHVRPLSELHDLQVLWLDITCLIDHLICPRTVADSLTALCELHLEMGRRIGTPCVRDSGGLRRLPALQPLELYTKEYCPEDLADYLSDEDVLIWQNQSSVRTIILRGSSKLGGFLEHDDLLALLPLKLPNLKRLKLWDCRDLQLQQLVKVLGVFQDSVVVKGVHGMTAQESREAWRAAAASNCELEFL